MFRLLPETPADSDEVEMLLDLAFAPGRHALSSYQLREGVAPLAELCRVARDDYDALAGAIRYWPVRIGEEAGGMGAGGMGAGGMGAGGIGHAALLLGPVAVHPTRQGEGLGALLILETLEEAREQGWKRVILVGDEPYYRRFGFTREKARALDFPKPVNMNRLLAKELVEEAMAGVTGMVRRWESAKSEKTPHKF